MLAKVWTAVKDWRERRRKRYLERYYRSREFGEGKRPFDEDVGHRGGYG